MTSGLHRVCRVDDIAAGEMQPFVIGKSRIVVCRKGSEFYALRDICSHHGAQLSRGVLGGTNVESEVGEFRFGKEGEVLRCPRHGFEFDIRTGRSLHDPEHQRVKSYPVVVRDGEVLVEMAS